MDNKKISEGDYVYFPGTKRPVQVVEGPNGKGEYAIEHGSMLLWVAGEKLEIVSDKKKLKRLKGLASKRKVKIADSDEVHSVDLHGCTRVEAKENLEMAVDRALREGVSKLEVIHGIGTGVVKEAVYEYLEGSRHVKSFREDDLNTGCVWVYL